MCIASVVLFPIEPSSLSSSLQMNWTEDWETFLHTQNVDICNSICKRFGIIIPTVIISYKNIQKILEVHATM